MTGLPDRSSDADEPLVLRAQEGDRAAFEELIRRHAGRLHAALLGFGLDDTDAEDVAQETFLRAWRALPRFEGRARFFTWLYRIGFNEAHRRLARRPAAPAEAPSEEAEIEDLVDTGPGPARRAEERELRATLARALGDLPPKLRAPVVLRDVEGLSTHDAAEVLELGEPAFKSRLHRGRMALRALLEPQLLASDTRR